MIDKEIDFILEQNNPIGLSKLVAANFVLRSLFLNMTQNELSTRSGVVLSTLKRFEQKAEISFRQLLALAVVLDATANFFQLFVKKQVDSIDEPIREKQVSKRERARTK